MKLSRILFTLGLLMTGAAASQAGTLGLSANPASIRADGKSTSNLTVTLSGITASSATVTANVALSASGPGTVSPNYVTITIYPGGVWGSASATLTSTKQAGTVTINAVSSPHTPASTQVTTYKGH